MVLMDSEASLPTDRTEVSFAVVEPPVMLEQKSIQHSCTETEEESLPVIPTSSFRNVTTILETTQNFMNTMEK